MSQFNVELRPVRSDPTDLGNIHLLDLLRLERLFDVGLVLRFTKTLVVKPACAIYEPPNVRLTVFFRLDSRPANSLAGTWCTVLSVLVTDFLFPSRRLTSMSRLISATNLCRA
jgi:hypothetical protein